MTTTGTDPAAGFAQALAAFQADLPPIGKTSKADTGKYGYTYAPLDVVSSTVMPLLAKHGMSFIASPTLTDTGHFCLRYALLHVSGHREEGLYPLPDPERVNPQQIGSAISYSRRYCLMAVTGVAPADEDDDGAKAVEGFTAGAHSKSKVQRRSKGQVDPAAADPWTAPVERVTDTGWFTGIQERLTLCGTPSEVRGLIAEARVQWAEGHLSDEDSQLWKRLSDERLAELTAGAA